jgi:hypothetical protein
MTSRSFIYDITFIDGLTLAVTAPNKPVAIDMAHAQYLDIVKACSSIVAIERRPPRDQAAPRALYSVRLSWGSVHTGIKLLACDAAAAIAAARHVFAVEYPSVPHMQTIVRRVLRLGTGYDESIITFAA